MRFMATNRFPNPCVKLPASKYTLSTLPSTYRWAHILHHTRKGISAMGIPPVYGVVFTGPAGNGKHSTAEALAMTLANQENAPHACLRISGCTLDTEEVADACAALDAVDAAFNAQQSWVCLLLDQPEQSRHNLAIQEHLYRKFLSRQTKLFPILICEDVSAVHPTFLKYLTVCPCLNPDEATRQNWFEDILAGGSEKKNAPLNLLGMNHISLARETDGFSWKQMSDLRTLLLRETVSKYLRNITAYNPEKDPNKGHQLLTTGKIQLLKNEVFSCIAIVRSQNTPAPQANAVPFYVSTASSSSSAPSFDDNSSDSTPAAPPKKTSEKSLLELLEV